MTTIYISNDNIITLSGLLNSSTGLYENSATVTVTLTDINGTNVSGQTWPTTMDYTAASNGDYTATLEDGLVISKGHTYIAKVSVDAGSDLIGYWEIDLLAQKRS